MKLKCMRSFQKLLSDSLFSIDSNLIKTVIIYENGREVVGKDSKGGKAIRFYVNLTFIDLMSNTVYHRHTLHGGAPRSRLEQGMSTIMVTVVL